MTNQQQDRLHSAALSLIIIIATAVRIYFLFQPIRYDEAFTFIMYAAKPLLVGLSTDYLPNNHLFHTILVRLTYLFLGNEPWLLRLPALLAGILIVPASYFSIRLLYNKQAALLTAAFTASSSILIEYSTLARGYTLICLFFLLLIILGIHLVEKDKPFVWYLLVIISVLGFFTIPIMLYPFGIVITWLFFYSLSIDKNSYHSIDLKNLLICIIITGLITSLLYIPVLTVSGFKSVFANRFVDSKSWSYFFSSFPSSLPSVWHQWNRDIPLVLNIILTIGFIVSVLMHKHLARYRVLIVLPVILFLLPILILQRVVPFTRVWLFLLPLYLGLSSVGIFHFIKFINSAKKYQSIICTIMALLLVTTLSLRVIRSNSINNSGESGVFRDAEKIAVFLKQYLQPNDKVYIICPSDYPLAYYFIKHEIPTNYLFSNFYSAKIILANVNHLIAIVNEPDQTLEGILNKGDISIERYDTAILVKNYNSAKIYELNRKKNQKL